MCVCCVVLAVIVTWRLLGSVVELNVVSELIWRNREASAALDLLVVVELVTRCLVGSAVEVVVTVWVNLIGGCRERKQKLKLAPDLTVFFLCSFMYCRNVTY